MPPTVLFIRVPEGDAVKNRLHFGISPIDVSTEDEVTGLLGLGATRTDVGQGPDRNWAVMADPEGDGFDVLRTLAPHNQAAISIRDPPRIQPLPRRPVSGRARRRRAVVASPAGPQAAGHPSAGATPIGHETPVPPMPQ